MNVLEVKQAVRKRDGYKCRKCGMTSDQHHADIETELHVHRLFPGLGYVECWCVTLCAPCHAAMPKKLHQLFDEDKEAHNGISLIALNLFHPRYRYVYDVLAELAKRHNATVENAALYVLEKWADEQGSDYCI